MALVNKEKQNTNTTLVPYQNELNEKELEFLLLLIKDASFKGDLVETVYNTTLKLQNQYLKFKNK